MLIDDGIPMLLYQRSLTPLSFKPNKVQDIAMWEDGEERLHSLLDVLALHYEQPEHLVLVQILLDLTQNPTTSAEIRQAVALHGERLSKAWQPLFVQALGAAAGERDLVRYAFSTLRGYLAANIVASSIHKRTDDTAERNLLVRGVAT